MSKHLSREIIEQLETHQLKGEEYVAVLLHLNSCPDCRQQLKIPRKEEIIKRIFDEDEQDDSGLKK